jgi:hypothetical protein
MADPGEGAGDEPQAVRPRRRGLVMTMIVIGTLLAFFAVVSIWVNRQALNTENWSTTSTQLLESPAIRTAVAGYLVDQAYTSFDVTGELRGVLPKQAKPLAGPAAGGLRNLAQQGIEQLLRRPAVQTLWAEANRRAHQRLMQVLNGGGGGISTQNGTVTLDLGTVLQQTANGIGVGQQAAQKLPPGSAQITILHSKQLKTAQDVVRALRTLPIVLLVLMFALYGGAIALAGRRREALRSIGVGLIIAGILALVARSIAGHAVVNELATTEAARPAVQDAWTIGTSQLVVTAWATVIYGALIVLAAWLAGPTRVAVEARSTIAPYMRDPRYAFGAVAVVMLIVVIWRPTPATHNAIAVIVLAGLLALGMEALRRQTAREHPDASIAATSARQRAWLGRVRGSASGAVERAQSRLQAARSSRSVSSSAPASSSPTSGARNGADEAAARIDAIERLARLRDAGVLDAQEFAAEKRRLLEQPPPS